MELECHHSPISRAMLHVIFCCLKISNAEVNLSAPNEQSFLNSFPNKPWFLCVCHRSLRKTLGKGEIALNEQFFLLPQCFLPVLRTFCHFHQI